MRRQKDSSPRRSTKKPRKRPAKKSKSLKEVPTKADKSKAKSHDEAGELDLIKTPKVEMPSVASEFIDPRYAEDPNFEIERTTASLITSSTGMADDLEELSISYGDFDEYQEEMGQAEISEEFKHEMPDETASNGYTESFNYVDCGSIQPSSTSMDATCESQPLETSEPIFVDLTADESKGSWKQSLFSRVEKMEDSKENSPDSPAGSKSFTIAIGESQIMIADSSSRLRRISDAGSLATALKDRGACTIPIQPNRSLPIRPAPPIPLRSSRTVRSPILKLSRALHVDVEEVPSFKSILPRSNFKLHEDTEESLPDYKEDHLITGPMENDFLLSATPRVDLNNDPKRKAENAKESKDAKRRKKAHEPDSSQTQEKPTEAVNDSSQNYHDKTTRKCGEIPEDAIKSWPEQKCSMSAESTTDDTTTKDRETGNKLVPPLRLKKITSTGGDRYRSSAVPVVPEKESNYRIVTGATPRPESRFQSHSIAPWTSANSENLSYNDEKAPSQGGKGDGSKPKNRRNRPKQKSRTLPRKVREIGESIVNSNPQKDANPKQASNRYEKQPENLSEAFGKLPEILAPPSDIVEVDDDYDDGFKDKLYIAEFDTKQETLDDDGDKSALGSPEPPKLSPRSPTDYAEHKLVETLRNSPPILPRVSLNVPSNFETRIDSLRMNDEKVWRMDGEDPRKLSKELNESMGELKPETARNYNGTEDEVKVMSPALIASQDSQTTRANAENSDESNVKDKNPLFDCLNKNEYEQTLDKGSREKKESQDAKIKLQKVVPLNCLEDSKESERNRLPKISRVENVNSELIVSAVTNAEAGTNVECNRTYELIVPNKNQAKSQSTTASTSILHVPSHYCGPIVNQESNLHSGLLVEARPAQVSSSGQSTSSNLESLGVAVTHAHVLPSTSVIPNQRVILLKTNKGDHVQTDVAPRSDNLRIMNEQFPTLGSWVSRMTKKQSRSKSKSQDAANALPVSGENSASFSASELQKVLTTTANNGTRTNVVNVAPQWNAERWQRQNHNQQRQQQQLLHQVAMPGTSQQPLPVASSLRPGVCQSIPVLSNSQFYPGGYSIDPYGTPLGYHSAICHFGPYPYHPRLHAGPPLTSYHMPIQEALSSHLRPLSQLQHVDKQFVALHESIRHIPADIMKYPASLTANGCQHSSGVEYERLRAASLSNNTGSTSCLPPLLMTTSPHVATSGAQTLMRPTMTGHSTANGQFSRSRIIPDVVAAAAAAAVMAAESIGRQQAPLTAYNQAGGETASPNNAPDSSQGSSTVKSALTNDVNGQTNGQNQTGASNVTKDMRATGFQHLQNFLMDRLPYMKTTDNFTQASSANDSHLPATVTTCSGHKASHPTYLHAQQCKESLTDGRHCETPHLGKVNRSLNIVSELPCSNCGVIGAVFKCLGCEAAFYCDERCQTQHWRVHVEKCPKKMPKLKKVT